MGKLEDMAAAELAHFRPAESEHNSTLLELFASSPMEGELLVQTERAPDFFRLYNIQRGSTECQTRFDQGVASVSGAFCVRNGWVDQQKVPVCYLGDLRTNIVGRRAAAVALAYGGVFEGVMCRHSCNWAYTTILASNKAAIQALVKRNPRRHNQPYYHFLSQYQTISVQYALPRMGRSGCRVRRAQPDEAPRIAAFLDADHRRRLFGYCFDDGELEHRLAHWPGYTLEQTFVVEDGAGRLLGCATAWNAKSVKRHRVLGYRGQMLWVKRGFDLVSPLLGIPRLPNPGGFFDYFYLANLSIKDDDPAVLNALLHHVARAQRSSSHHFFLLSIDDDSPLRAGLRGLIHRSIPFRCYGVTRADAARTELPASRLGYEIALM